MICRDGKLQVGDEIINVDGKRLRGIDVEAARRLLRSDKDVTDIVIGRDVTLTPPTPPPRDYDHLLKPSTRLCGDYSDLRSLSSAQEVEPSTATWARTAAAVDQVDGVALRRSRSMTSSFHQVSCYQRQSSRQTESYPVMTLDGVTQTTSHYQILTGLQVRLVIA